MLRGKEESAPCAHRREAFQWAGQMDDLGYSKNKYREALKARDTPTKKRVSSSYRNCSIVNSILLYLDQLAEVNRICPADLLLGQVTAQVVVA